MISIEETLFNGSPGFGVRIRKSSPFSAITDWVIGFRAGDSLPCSQEAAKGKAEQVINN